VTRPRGTTSDSERGHSPLGGRSHGERALAAADDASAADQPPPVTDDLLDQRERRQARGRKKPGPTRTLPANPSEPPTDAPPTEI
jgi:hypothetical protein